MWSAELLLQIELPQKTLAFRHLWTRILEAVLVSPYRVSRSARGNFVSAHFEVLVSLKFALSFFYFVGFNIFILGFSFVHFQMFHFYVFGKIIVVLHYYRTFGFSFEHFPMFYFWVFGGIHCRTFAFCILGISRYCLVAFLERFIVALLCFCIWAFSGVALLRFWRDSKLHFGVLHLGIFRCCLVAFWEGFKIALWRFARVQFSEVQLLRLGRNSFRPTTSYPFSAVWHADQVFLVSLFLASGFLALLFLFWDYDSAPVNEEL